MPKPLSFDPAMRHPAVVDYAGKRVHGGDGRQGAYRIGMEREQRFGRPMGGTPGLCFPVNAGGAAMLTWNAQGDGTYAVNLTQDYITHPCPDERAFSWFALEDTVQAGGGPFCRPDELRTTVNVLWDYRVQRGATVAARAFVGLGMIWDGYGAFVEVNFNSHNWWASQPGDPDVQIVAHPAGWDFVAIDGEGLGLRVPKATHGTLVIAWRSVLDTLIARWDTRAKRHFLMRPSDWAKSATTHVYVGMELATGEAHAPSIVGSLWLSGLRQEQIP